MPDTTALYQLEVKLPSGENGESRTQVVKLKEEKTIEFSTRGEFPSTGDSSLLYIATDENKIYRWDAVSATYVVVGAAQSEMPDLSDYVTQDDLDNYVTLDTTQTISGTKTFIASNSFTNETLFSHGLYAPA